MKVIICGAGQVGRGIAAFLSTEPDVDVTVIDNNPDIIQDLNTDMDVRGMVGVASQPGVLDQAGAANTDLLIATTSSDEVNMLVCQIGHSLFKIPTKIARIRSSDYLQHQWSELFTANHIPIDQIISPEVAIAESIYKTLKIPGAFDVKLLNDNVYVVGCKCLHGSDAANQQVKYIHDTKNPFRIIGIWRDQKFQTITDQTKILPGDDVYILSDLGFVQKAMEIFGHKDQGSQKIAIFGGGRIGYRLSQLLSNDTKLQHNLKIFEYSRDRAEFLAEVLPRAVVIHGNVLDRELLIEEHIEKSDTVIALTNDDENNILSSLLTKKLGVKRVISLINNRSYNDFMPDLGLDVMVNPRLLTVTKILQHIRKGQWLAIHGLRHGYYEVLEIKLNDQMDILYTKLEDITWPDGVKCLALYRKGELLFPQPSDELHEEDCAIFLCPRKKYYKLEKMLSAKLKTY